MTMTVPVFDESSVSRGNRKDGRCNRGMTRRLAEPPTAGWRGGSVRSRKAREASGSYTGKGEMEGVGGGNWWM